LAYKRHFPAINWLNSYSLYLDDVEPWFNEFVDPAWMETRQKLMSLLQDEAELEEIVKMVGMDALSAGDRLKMEAARSIREDYLHQNSFHEIDTYTSLKKQYYMMTLVYGYYEQAAEALKKGASISDLLKLEVREAIGRFKYTQEDQLDERLKEVQSALHNDIAAAVGRKEDLF
jgi:V/A-type H+-transporting ATPase subunit A